MNKMFSILVLFSCIIALGSCKKTKLPDLSDEGKTISTALSLIDDPHKNSIEREIPYFQEFHGLLHLINGLIEDEEYEALDLTLPFLNARFRKLMLQEGWIGLENKDYRYRLAQLDKAVIDFQDAFKKKDLPSMRKRYKEMHNAYTRILDYRPEQEKPAAS